MYKLYKKYLWFSIAIEAAQWLRAELLSGYGHWRWDILGPLEPVYWLGGQLFAQIELPLTLARP